jgi:DNA-binding GntR family transcriptional regulator
MIPLNHDENEVVSEEVEDRPAGKSARVQLAGEISSTHYRTGGSVKLSEIAARYHLDEDAVLKILAEFQALGMVTLSEGSSAVVRSSSPEEMQEAYQIRAALEEIGGRAAARALEGNSSALQRKVDDMVAAFRRHDLDSFVEHDVVMVDG